MFRITGVTSAAALALISLPAFAASDDDLASIRAEIDALKANYEARIRALEERLQKAEHADARPPSSQDTQVTGSDARDTAQAASTQADAASGTAAPTAQAQGSPPSGSSPSQPSGPTSAGASSLAAFNPALSAVLQGTYARLSQDPNAYRIANYALPDDLTPGKRGFGLGESELALFANVDDKFAGNLIFSLMPENTVSVEEAYGVYTAAPYGVVPKFGRFFSGLGYLNEQHQHAWDFYDAPLAYQAFLGGQYTNDGVQVKWVAPLDEFVELGAELGSGASFPGNDRDRNGVGSATVYAHTGGDIGDSQSWRAGLSYLETHAADREWNALDSLGNDSRVAFTGKSRLAVADFVWKYAPHGNPTSTNLKVQAEYVWRRERGDLTDDGDGASGVSRTSAYSSRQQGGYVQGVWQFMPYWRVGARFDWLSGGGVDYGENSSDLATPPYDPRRYAMMVDYSPSEFSRIRLQLAQAHVRRDATDNELFLQYILSIGAHGAHKF